MLARCLLALALLSTTGGITVTGVQRITHQTTVKPNHHATEGHVIVGGSQIVSAVEEGDENLTTGQPGEIAAAPPPPPPRPDSNDVNDMDVVNVDSDGVVITGTYQISHNMRVTIGTNERMLKELALLRELRMQTQRLMDQHERKLREYDEHIAMLETGSSIMAIDGDSIDRIKARSKLSEAEGPTMVIESVRTGSQRPGDGGAGGATGRGAVGTTMTGLQGRAKHLWFMRDIDAEQQQAEHAGEGEGQGQGQGQTRGAASDGVADMGEEAVTDGGSGGAHGSPGKSIGLTEPPHTLSRSLNRTSVQILQNATSANCSQLHQDAYAVVEFSAYAIDYDNRELLRFEHHTHPDVRAVHVSGSGDGLLFAELTHSLLGMCTGEKRELIIPAHLGFAHAKFDGNNATDFPVPRNTTIMLRLQLLQFSSLAEHVHKITHLETLIEQLKSQVRSVEAMQSSFEWKQNERTEKERRDQEQRARQKRYEDQLNWAALAVGVAYCLYKWQVDKRQRRERLAYLMGDAAGNGKKGGKNKSK